MGKAILARVDMSDEVNENTKKFLREMSLLASENPDSIVKEKALIEALVKKHRFNYEIYNEEKARCLRLQYVKFAYFGMAVKDSYHLILEPSGKQLVGDPV